MQRLFASALFSGLIVGLIATALQFGFVIPLLLEGELYESGARLHFSATGSPQSPSGAPPYTAEHARHLLTVAFNMINYTAFGLFMVAGYAILENRGQPITQRDGLLWGIAGFAIVLMAPAFGLPPELPGTIAPEVGPRQAWWLGTVLATLAGILAISFVQGTFPVIIGLALILAPHIIGAPQLETYFGIAPPELSAHFVTRTLGVGLVAWLALGAFTAYFWNRPAAH